MNSTNFDVIVCGNGILGSSIAYTLSQENPSAKIAIIAPVERPGAGSLAAGAMLASFAEVEKGSLDAGISRYKFELTHKATHMWPEWAEGLNRFATKENKIDINFGTYIIQNTRAGELDDENFDSIMAALNYYNEPHQEVDPRSIENFHPSTESRSLGALYLPGEGAVLPHKIFAVLDNYLKQNKNIEIVDEHVAKFDIRDGKIKGITSKSGKSYAAGTVVLAAGAKSQEILDETPDLSKRIPRMVYGVGCGIVLKSEGISPKKVIRSSNRGLACGMHMVPYDKDFCYVGASNFITPVPEYHPRATSLLLLVQSAIEQVNTKHYKSKVERVIVGHRPTTIDTFPLIGKTSVDGLWILSGTKRDGIHMSPLYATSMAKEINGGNSTFENPFKPERRPIHTMTKEEGIAKAIENILTAAVQHELHMPKAGWDDMVTDMIRRKVEEVYDKCGITTFGIPPEMIDMYRYGHVGEIYQEKVQQA